MKLACSRRSDSGERCEVQRSAKKIKSSPPLLFIAFFTLHRSPLSERLEQAIMNQTCLAKLIRLLKFSKNCCKKQRGVLLFETKSVHACCAFYRPQPPGGYSQKNWVGVCGPLPKTLTLFMTKICDFPYPIYDLTKNLIPYL